MAIFAYLLCGLVVGVVARIALPETRVGLWSSVILGAAGGVFGGLMDLTLSPQGAFTSIHPLGVALAVLVSGLLSVGVILMVQRHQAS